MRPLLRYKRIAYTEIADVFLPMQRVSSELVAEALCERPDGGDIERVLGMAEMPILGARNNGL